MRNSFLTLLLLLTATLSIQAQQTPNAVLKSISEKLEKDCCITADLILTDNTSYAVLGNNTKGSLKISKECFVIDVALFRLWFDGTTLWTMNTMNGYEEIYVTSPDKEEAALFNPINIFKQPGLTVTTNADKDGLKSISVTSQQLVIGDINLQLEILYNPTTYRIEKVTGMDRFNQSQNIAIAIKNYKSGLELNKETFQCPVSNYPDAEIVDMR
ncbi:MAG: hypothetical protein J6Q97_05520 [Bacteroidaceae bacterium]|nr:hypothetical protein [Bacteroidaceae bacterium]MBO5951216.1 hypothetical protein [Bacteroidaceae bacterium]